MALSHTPTSLSPFLDEVSPKKHSASLIALAVYTRRPSVARDRLTGLEDGTLDEDVATPMNGGGDAGDPSLMLGVGVATGAAGGGGTGAPAGAGAAGAAPSSWGGTSTGEVATAGSPWGAGGAGGASPTSDGAFAGVVDLVTAGGGGGMIAVKVSLPDSSYQCRICCVQVCLLLLRSDLSI